MRIENVTKEKLSKACDKELLILKLRFTQMWDKNLKNDSPIVVADLTRGQFLKSYRLLLNEVGSRKLENSTSSIDKAAFKKAMTISKFGLDASDFEDVVLAENYIFIDASTADKDKFKAAKAAVEVGLVEDFSKAEKPKIAYIPLYDLVLKAKQETVIIEVSKPYPNEHSARLKDPKLFNETSFRKTKGGQLGGLKIPTSISVIWGKLKNKAQPTDHPVLQALRFSTKDWNVTKAKKWLSDNKITHVTFESATKKTKKLWCKSYISKLPDTSFIYMEYFDNEEEDDSHTKVAKTRYFPYKDKDGNVDVPHLEDAIKNNISKSELSEAIKKEVQKKAESLLSDTKEGKIFEKFVSIHAIDKADKEEHIVCGIVYEPDTEDSQGDEANEEEIRKAAYQFMEKVQLFKVMHKGKKVKVKILESYIAPVKFTLAKQKVKKGTWLITVRVLDKKIWKAVKDGELNGFSMAGYAKTEGDK